MLMLYRVTLGSLQLGTTGLRAVWGLRGSGSEAGYRYQDRQSMSDSSH
jgi:hypothetical protein